MSDEISTSCRGCFFSVVKDGKQKDCYADMFPVLKESESLIMDGDYFKTSKRFCPYYRPDSWAGELSQQQALVKANRERTLEVAAVVSCENKTLEDLKETVANLVEQTEKLHNVVFVTTTTGGIRPSQVVLYMRDQKVPFSWSVRDIRDPSYAEYDAIHEGAQDAKGVFLLFCVAGRRISKTIVEDLDYQVTWLNRRVALVDTREIHGTIVQSGIYSAVGGWSEVSWEDTGEKTFSVAEKIRRMAKSQGSKIIILDGVLIHGQE